MKKIKITHKSACMILAKIEKVENDYSKPTTNSMIKEYSEKYRESISSPIHCPYIISKI